VAILNQHSDYLNSEAADVLAYQTSPVETTGDADRDETDRRGRSAGHASRRSQGA
jgi:hypothetical protein